jgi:hypothetical protein
MPRAWTKSSTRRVETPAIQASWMTAASAFGHLARLDERREVGALPELGDPELKRPQAGIERAGAVAVAVVDPGFAARVLGGAAQTLDLELHQPLQGQLGHGFEEVAVVGLLQGHAVVGHRGAPVRSRGQRDLRPGSMVTASPRAGAGRRQTRWRSLRRAPAPKFHHLRGR